MQRLDYTSEDYKNYRVTFGTKHLGKALDDCSADWLLWCYEQDWCRSKHPLLYAYVDKNRKHLEKGAGNRWQKSYKKPTGKQGMNDTKFQRRLFDSHSSAYDVTDDDMY
jgi:hypothetical protein